MDGEEKEKASDGGNVHRYRKHSRGSQSTLSNSYKPDYNPERYSDASPSYSGSVRSPSGIEGYSFLPKNMLPEPPEVVHSDFPGLSVLQKTGNHDRVLMKRSMEHIGDFTHRSKVNSVKSLNRSAVSEDLHMSNTGVSSGLKMLNHPGFSKGLDVLSSPVNGWSGMGDEGLMSPDSERSQANSFSTMSTSVDSSNSVSHGSASLNLLLRQPSEAVLAQQYFPLTFGATVHQPSSSSSSSKDPLLHAPAALTLTKKSSRSHSAGHRRHHRPGSGHSSSSSNSKSSVDRIYLMASEAQGNGVSVILSSTPYQIQLARLQREQLEIEEERLRYLKIQEEVERARGPLPNWYEIKSPQFHYEAHKNNEHLKGSSDVRTKNSRHKPSP